MEIIQTQDPLKDEAASNMDDDRFVVGDELQSSA